MTRKLVVALLAFAAIAAHAAPIPFFGVQADTSAVAVAGGAADFQSATSPPTALPLTSDAAAIGASDIATAGALAALGLLSTSADVTGVTGATSGVGTAHFMASFSSQVLSVLTIDLDVFGAAAGGGFGGATLFLTLTSGGTTLIDEVFAASTERSFSFRLPTGTGVLDLLLVSEASTLSGGAFASNAASVLFAVAVPLPATYALLVAALVALVVVRRSSAGMRSPPA